MPPSREFAYLTLASFIAGRILGTESVRTDEPSEHVDTKILKTLAELDSGDWLPLGLRAHSFVEVIGNGTKE